MAARYGADTHLTGFGFTWSPRAKVDAASFAFAQVERDGSFQIPDVVDGSYALRLYGLEQGWYVKSARMGAEDVLQKGLEVERGSSGGTLEIVLSAASAQLEGTVTEHDKPVAGAQVRVKPDPETPYNRILFDERQHRSEWSLHIQYPASRQVPDRCQGAFSFI